jgi:NTE family protein
MTIISLVLSGGGVRALAHVGAIARLSAENKLDTITHYAGSSAGAIVAALVASGYTPKELFNFMIRLNFRSFAQDNIVKEGVNLVRTFGIHDNGRLEQVVEHGIAAKLGARVTFGQLKTQTGNTLIITATNLTTSQTDIFSPEKTPNMIISKAIRLSADIPFFYTSCQYNGCTYTDGGLLNNLPTKYVPPPSISINLTSSGVLPRKVNGISSYMYALLETMSDEIDKVRTKLGKVIDIDTGSIAATDFDITLTERIALVKKGYFMKSDLLNKVAPSVPDYWFQTLNEIEDQGRCNIM